MESLFARSGRFRSPRRHGNRRRCNVLSTGRIRKRRAGRSRRRCYNPIGNASEGRSGWARVRSSRRRTGSTARTSGVSPQPGSNLRAPTRAAIRWPRRRTSRRSAGASNLRHSARARSARRAGASCTVRSGPSVLVRRQSIRAATTPTPRRVTTSGFDYVACLLAEQAPCRPATSDSSWLVRPCEPRARLLAQPGIRGGIMKSVGRALGVHRRAPFAP
jgi:hypothetical protein